MNTDQILIDNSSDSAEMVLQTTCCKKKKCCKKYERKGKFCGKCPKR